MKTKYTHYYEYQGDLEEYSKGNDLEALKKSADIWANSHEKLRQVIKDRNGVIVYETPAFDLKAFNAKMKAENAKFNRLPLWRQRVQIAKDVLEWLKIRKLTPVQMSYFSIDSAKDYEYNNDSQLQEVLLDKVESCNVCAKGAIFACSVARKNDVTVGDSKDIDNFDSEPLSEILGGVFSAHQLRLIETEFEQKDHDYSHAYYSRKRIREIKPVMKDLRRLTPKGRMVRIMNNIIRNKGWFKPELG